MVGRVRLQVLAKLMFGSLFWYFAWSIESPDDGLAHFRRDGDIEVFLRLYARDHVFDKLILHVVVGEGIELDRAVGIYRAQHH